MSDKITIELTRTEAENLADFIEVDFLVALKEDAIDNFYYMCNICNAFKTIKKALEGDSK